MNRARRSRSRRAAATSAGERTRVALALAACFAASCAARTGATPDDGGAAGAAGTFGFAGASGAGGQAGALVLDPIPDGGYPVPQPGEVGGYLLGNMIAAAQLQGPLMAASSTGCFKLRGIVRDFKGALPAVGGSLQPGGHPDFEVFEGKGITKGLVGLDLDAFQKPRYTGICELGAPKSDICPYGAMTTSAANFAQWYTSHEGVNKTYFVYFEVPSNGQGNSQFFSRHFFPLDRQGFGNSGVDGDNPTIQRNYSFTTELHTSFRYNGHETFTFTGDDDVWIFINNKLAVDLGGLHDIEVGMVDLDAQATTLGIQKGMVYPLDLFHAERHSVKSDFGFELNFLFQDCGYIIP